jgi:hypothetical protein
MGVVGVLERQQVARARGETVLSVVVGETPHAWGAWAASRGCLALLGDDTAGAIPNLLGQFPWVRAIVPARARFATTSGLSDAEIDAALDARGDEERWRWVCDQVGHDEHALVAGWILVSLRMQQPPAAPVRDVNKTASRGAFGKQLEKLRDAAGKTTPFMLRTLAVPTGAASTKALADFLKAEGLRETLDNETLRALAAHAAFVPDFPPSQVAAWRRRDKPLSSLQVMARILELPPEPVVIVTPVVRDSSQVIPVVSVPPPMMPDTGKLAAGTSAGFRAERCGFVFPICERSVALPIWSCSMSAAHSRSARAPESKHEATKPRSRNEIRDRSPVATRGDLVLLDVGRPHVFHACAR